MKYLSVFVSSCLLSASAASGNDNEVEEYVTHDFKGHRDLRYARNKLAWPECQELNLTVDECFELIEKELEIGHVLTNVSVNKKYPPPVDDAMADEMFASNDYYYRFAVPTNYLAQVTGYQMDGQITYDHKWNGIRTGPREIGPWDCKGKSPVLCCSDIKREIRDRDNKHNYIDCWVHQQEPVPYHKGRQISYCTWVYNKNTHSYMAQEAHPNKQIIVANSSKSKLGYVVSELQGFLDSNRVPYNSLVRVSRNLHFHGRALEHVQKAAADMDAYLHRPNLPGDILPVDTNMKELLEWTIHALVKYIAEPFDATDTHTLTVHSGDATGSFVRHTPMIGVEPGQPACVPS
jgi:hypothetical protein